MFAEFPLSEKFSVQPEFHYSSVREDGESIENLILFVFFKYYITEKFNVMSGLQFDYMMEKDLANFRKFGLGLGIGLGYDITDSILISSRYSFGITDRTEISSSLFDISAKTNVFQIGLGFRF